MHAPRLYQMSRKLSLADKMWSNSPEYDAAEKLCTTAMRTM